MESEASLYVILLCAAIGSEICCLLFIALENDSRLSGDGLMDRWESARVSAASHHDPECQAKHAAEATRLARVILALALFGWAGSWIVLGVVWLFRKSRVPALLDDALVQPVKRRCSRRTAIDAAAAAPEAGALSNPADAGELSLPDAKRSPNTEQP